MKQNFPLKDILTITTGRCLEAGDWGGVKRLTAYLFGDPDGAVHTLTMAHLRNEAAYRLMTQYPQLPDDTVFESVPSDFDWTGWLVEQKVKYGDTLSVALGSPDPQRSKR